MGRHDKGEPSEEGSTVGNIVNGRGCNSKLITIEKQFCSKDIELFAVNMRPYYLPQEFSHAIVFSVYSSSANADMACDVTHPVTRLQAQYCHALLLISGVFNHASQSFMTPETVRYCIEGLF